MFLRLPDLPIAAYTAHDGVGISRSDIIHEDREAVLAGLRSSQAGVALGDVGPRHFSHR
jgi:hypothetical protein